jgi:hypothetical protein
MHPRHNLGQSKRGMTTKSVVSQRSISNTIACAICEEDVIDLFV